jgi:SRSO17 transposase
MQRLFTTARWDQDAVRDDLRGYVAAALGDPGGVLIGDDTGFEKGGSRSAGVQRQYAGTAGKITNCQLGVFLAYASVKGRALIGRELYLPRSWTGDQERLAAAKVPEGTAFATKPQLLQAMIERAVAAGIPFGWVTADEVYGHTPQQVPLGCPLRTTPRPAARPPLVTMAPPPSGTRPPIPLPATTITRSLSAAGVLSVGGNVGLN